MRDGQHEGHPGHRIDQIIQDIDRSDGTKPNIYLINAVSSAYTRIGRTTCTDFVCQRLGHERLSTELP